MGVAEEKLQLIPVGIIQDNIPVDYESNPKNFTHQLLKHTKF